MECTLTPHACTPPRARAHRNAPVRSDAVASRLTASQERLGLCGPQHFRRYGAKASAAPADAPPTDVGLTDAPQGYVLRECTEADVAAVLELCARWPVGSSAYGSQNFVADGWAAFDEDQLRAAIARAPSRGLPMPRPRLLIEERTGRIVAFASLAMLRFGSVLFCQFRYADGEPEHLDALLHCLPDVARSLECDSAGGYVPALPWLVDALERSQAYSRMTQTEQLEYHWSNAQMAARWPID